MIVVGCKFGICCHSECCLEAHHLPAKERGCQYLSCLCRWCLCQEATSHLLSLSVLLLVIVLWKFGTFSCCGAFGIILSLFISHLCLSLVMTHLLLLFCFQSQSMLHMLQLFQCFAGLAGRGTTIFVGVMGMCFVCCCYSCWWWCWHCCTHFLVMQLIHQSDGYTFSFSCLYLF